MTELITTALMIIGAVVTFLIHRAKSKTPAQEMINALEKLQKARAKTRGVGLDAYSLDTINRLDRLKLLLKKRRDTPK